MEPNIKTIIIDDEADGRNIIALLLEQLFPGIACCGQAENVASGLELIRAQQPDLIFLDVEMPDGNAFDLLAACTGLQAQVILVTAHNHYAFRAIKASVLDYLLKPVNKAEFETAVQKALGRIRQGTGSDLSGLLAGVHRQLHIRKIRIPTLHGFSLANVDDIVRCEAAGNYTIIIFSDLRRITASRTLGDYEDDLKTFGFVRIHHKHLINISRVIEYNKGKSGGGYVTLQGGELLEVSARRKADLLNAFGR